MSFNDIFKKSFLEQFELASTLDIVISLLVSVLIGAYIFYFYKKTYKGVMFSKLFAVALTGMTVITTFIILAVTSDVVLSLGMVGALSIVRFRSSIKEPVDIIYIFWAISEGIVIGSRQYLLALIGTVCISIAMWLFGTYKEKYKRYILVVRHNGDNLKVLELIKANTKKYEIKSNNVFKNNEQELIVEVILNDESEKLVEAIRSIENINMVSLVKYNGEYIIE